MTIREQGNKYMLREQSPKYTSVITVLGLRILGFWRIGMEPYQLSNHALNHVSIFALTKGRGLSIPRSITSPCDFEAQHCKYHQLDVPAN